jgi:hypothetical protein
MPLTKQEQEEFGIKEEERPLLRTEGINIYNFILMGVLAGLWLVIILGAKLILRIK